MDVIIDYCPACGKWDQQINEYTGWCLSCTLGYHPDKLMCKRCGDLFPRNKNGLYCSPCKDRNWLEQHIDEVEIYMLRGYAFSVAKKIVAASIRPTCVVCSNPIKGGKPNALFCRNTEQCRTIGQKYRTLVGKGMPNDIALSVLGYGPDDLFKAA
jgi:hypothetical protein